MSSSVSPIVASQALWTYHLADTERSDQDFFTALQKDVAAELTARFRQNSRLWVGREAELLVGQYRVRARLSNLEPVLATNAGPTTRFVAQYRERAANDGQDIAAFVAETIRYPDPQQAAVFASLVGLDAIKQDLMQKLILLVGANYLDQWVSAQYPQQRPERLLQALRDRYPLIILEGDVGSGKTALARSVGDQLAKSMGGSVVLVVVNAQVRGGGHVGELTLNIARAFNEAEKLQEREQLPVLILIDEADALAQIRGGAQTHHEDDAGVNTLIQRIDRLRGKPMAILFATNLAQSLDAAIMRRAIALYHFERPTPAQRADVFTRLLTGTGIAPDVIERLVSATEPRPIAGFGAGTHRYTFSDIAQRIVPRAVEAAIYGRRALAVEDLLGACQAVPPTPELHHER